MARVLVVIVLGGGLFAAVAFHLGLFQNKITDETKYADTTSKTTEPLGDDLYAPKPDIKIETLKERRTSDPITVVGTLNVYDKQEVSSPIDGTLLCVGEEIPLGAQLIGGIAPFLPDPCYVAKVKFKTFRTRTTWSNHEESVVYRRLMKGDVVEKGQMLAMLNTTKANVEMRNKSAKVALSESDYSSAVQKAETYKLIYENNLKLSSTGAVTPQELAIHRATWKTADYEALSKLQAMAEAHSNLEQAQFYLSQHSILNQVPTSTAIIKEISKSGGEGVKPGDKILELQSMGRFMIEGSLEMQYYSRVREGMRVTIEPIQEEAPIGQGRKFHRAEVNSVAFTNDPVPLIVSGSEDHSILLWDRNLSAPLQPQIQFKDPVRVVACSPQGCAHNIILAGCADGSIYLWDLQDPAQKTPRKINADQTFQGEAVTSLAVSPDGNFFASGGDNSSIKMWNLDAIRKIHAAELIAERIRNAREWAAPTGALKISLDRAVALLDRPELKDALDAGNVQQASAEVDAVHKELAGGELLYPFDELHGATNSHYGSITSLHFTPQCRLVSASRDNTVRVWALKKKGVVPVGFPIPNRKGDVSQLGVSADGRFMLFDQGKTLQILAVEDGRVINTLQTPGNSVDFQVSAIFSPDSSLMLTAGSAEGRLQLWSTPIGSVRGYEVRQFVSDERSPVTCAAFAPMDDPSNKNRGSLAVSGTKDGYVYVWPIPSANEVLDHPIRDVTLTSVYNNIEKSTRHIQLGVDVRNQPTPQHPHGRLIPGRSVTIVIQN